MGDPNLAAVQGGRRAARRDGYDHGGIGEWPERPEEEDTSALVCAGTLVQHGGHSPPVSLSDAPAQELMIHRQTRGNGGAQLEQDSHRSPLDGEDQGGVVDT
jgi:hypothetical protein